MDKRIEMNRIFLAGISVRTSNRNGKSQEDLGALWQRFYAETIPAKIQDALNSKVYSVYTDYESDYKGDYTAFIGLEVPGLTSLPEGLEGLEISGGKFIQIKAKGEPMSAVPKAWADIWQKDDELNRAYKADFEVYDESSQAGPNSLVNIYLSVL